MQANFVSVHFYSCTRMWKQADTASKREKGEKIDAVWAHKIQLKLKASVLQVSLDVFWTRVRRPKSFQIKNLYVESTSTTRAKLLNLRVNRLVDS